MDEFDDVMEWAWSDGIAAIDAKDKEYVEASAHMEMFIVLGEVLNRCGWSRDELIQVLDEGVFDHPQEPVERLH